MITSTTPQVADNVMASVIQEADDLISGFATDMQNKKSAEQLENNRRSILNEVQSVLNERNIDECNQEQQFSVISEALSIVIHKIEDNYDFVQEIETNALAIRDKEQWTGEYAKICSSPGINRIPYFATRDYSDGEQNGETLFVDSGVTLKVSSGDGFYRDSTSKLLQTLLIKLTAQNRHKSPVNKVKNTVEVTVTDYAKIRKIPDTKSSRDNLIKELRRDMTLLKRTSISWVTQSGKSVKRHDYNLFSGTVETCGGVKNGTIKFLFNRDLAFELVQGYLMLLPMQILQLDSRNRNLRPVFMKLVENYCMLSNLINHRNNIIGVRTLLDECNAIPNYETVMETDRAITRRIIKPFKKVLDELQNYFGESYGFTWEYSNSKQKPLTNDQKTLLDKGDYSTFIELYVVYDIPCLDPPLEDMLKEKLNQQKERELEQKRKNSSKRKTKKDS